MIEQVEVVIIGGGQAGLALSYYLTQQGRTHLVLEQGQVGETWRSGRWDSFTLNTPNWMTQLPGFAYQDDDPDGFLPREEVVDYLERYAASFHAPLHCGVRVTALRQHPAGDGYLVEAEQMTLAARNVVLATGAFPQPKLPEARVALSTDLYQLHTSEYRNRGKDSTWWLARLGFYDRTLDQLPSPTAKFACNPHVSGNQGGHDINLRHFARQGMTLLGHVQEASGKQLLLAPDLEENLAMADAFAAHITQGIDEYITKTGMEVVANRTTGEAQSNGATPTKPLLTMDLQSAGISTIIWASGYQLDFGWVHIPVFDQAGYPVHRRGITASPGLYFLGLHWLYKTKSALLFGIGEDAAFIASAIADKG